MSVAEGCERQHAGRANRRSDGEESWIIGDDTKARDRLRSFIGSATALKVKGKAVDSLSGSPALNRSITEIRNRRRIVDGGKRDRKLLDERIRPTIGVAAVVFDGQSHDGSTSRIRSSGKRQSPCRIDGWLNLKEGRIGCRHGKRLQDLRRFKRTTPTVIPFTNPATVCAPTSSLRVTVLPNGKAAVGRSLTGTTVTVKDRSKIPSSPNIWLAPTLIARTVITAVPNALATVDSEELPDSCRRRKLRLDSGSRLDWNSLL